MESTSKVYSSISFYVAALVNICDIGTKLTAISLKLTLVITILYLIMNYKRVVASYSPQTQNTHFPHCNTSFIHVLQKRTILPLICSANVQSRQLSSPLIYPMCPNAALGAGRSVKAPSHRLATLQNGSSGVAVLFLSPVSLCHRPHYSLPLTSDGFGQARSVCVIDLYGVHECVRVSIERRL